MNVFPALPQQVSQARIRPVRPAGSARHTVALGLLLLWLTACRPASAQSQGRVFFIEPGDGAVVGNPVRVRMGAENFTVEPAGAVRAGAGHLHITINADCVPAGQVVPKDDQHLHFGQGQTEADLDLAPGTHRLCLQAADGAHTALAGDGMTHIVEITVE